MPKLYMRLFVHTCPYHPEREHGFYVGPLDGICATHGALRIGTNKDDYSDLPISKDGLLILDGVPYTDIDFVGPRDIPKGSKRMTYADFHVACRLPRPAAGTWTPTPNSLRRSKKADNHP